MGKNKSIVFLHSELAGYFLSCIRALRGQFEGRICVIHWPVNPEAPFEFDFPSGVEFVEKSVVNDLIGYLGGLNPTTVVSSGWMDKDYLQVCKLFKGRCNTILTLDNHWTGSIKQRIACLLSPFFIANKFSHAWVPGKIQEKFARKLGIKNVLLDYYCCDVSWYNDLYNRCKDEKERLFPKKFLYVGRYVEHKGIYEMWEAFTQAIGKEKDWELWCLGVGDQFDEKTEHPQIKHFGFVQPDQMAKFIKDTSIFILPSKFEPWGVVVHEYATAGFPMIVADGVGAAEKYVVDGVNGHTFKRGNTESLKLAFEQMMRLTDKEYVKMSRESSRLGNEFTPADWAKKLMEVDLCVG